MELSAKERGSNCERTSEMGIFVLLFFLFVTGCGGNEKRSPSAPSSNVSSPATIIEEQRSFVPLKTFLDVDYLRDEKDHTKEPVKVVEDGLYDVETILLRGIENLARKDKKNIKTPEQKDEYDKKFGTAIRAWRR